VHEFGFQSAEAAFHWCVVPAISLPAHGLDHPGRVENFAVIDSGVLAAAIGMVSQARRRLLPLDGHGQGCDSQFRPHVVTHRPADDFAGEEIEHHGQIERTRGLEARLDQAACCFGTGLQNQGMSSSTRQFGHPRQLCA
jgi:hypothetical protein